MMSYFANIIRNSQNSGLESQMPMKRKTNSNSLKAVVHPLLASLCFCLSGWTWWLTAPDALQGCLSVGIENADVPFIRLSSKQCALSLSIFSLKGLDTPPTARLLLLLLTG